MQLSASQAAKLFRLRTAEISLLEEIRQMIIDSSEMILNLLFSRLSMLPGGATLFGDPGQTGKTRGRMRKWLKAGLRPWHPDVRESHLRHLALYCARKGVPAPYITSVFLCLEYACKKVLTKAANREGIDATKFHKMESVFRKRIMTEHLGFVLLYSRYSKALATQQRIGLEQTIKVRSRRLASTVSLSQAVTSEIDQDQVVRVLARHVMDIFAPDFLAIHSIESEGVVETPIMIVGQKVVTCQDDDAMHRLRKDWHLCRAARIGQTYYVADAGNTLEGCPYRAWAKDAGSYCCIPLTSGTNMLGWMYLRRDETDAFSEEDIEVLGIYGQMVGTAITSLRLVEENKQQATTDPLTGLHNRRYFEEAMHKDDMLRNRRGGSSSLLMLDVDKFKKFNDSYGHDTGDRVLVAFTSALRQSVRATDEVARLGGDEFAILLRDCEADEACRIAAKIVRLARETTVYIDASRSEHLEVSAGVAVCPENAQTLQEALLLADIALLQAKEAGRNDYQVYDRELHGAAVG
ncbi:MAG: sensor domain-containing diguanylate cyclase [Phycisphaerae bacterium]|nr:sensor domain-containing diguanylate cyclase [Phycisphaerae bacterium]